MTTKTTTQTATRPAKIAMASILAAARKRAQADRYAVLSSLVPEYTYNYACDALDAALADDPEHGAGRRALDAWFGADDGCRAGADERHIRGRWCLVTNNAQDRIVRA